MSYCILLSSDVESLLIASDGSSEIFREMGIDKLETKRIYTLQMIRAEATWGITVSFGELPVGKEGLGSVLTAQSTI